ncbi:hypothetical protein OROMI_017436 [Orobanche minor]
MGQFFGFVKFKDVEDEKDLESKLQGTKCRDVELGINLEKHKRKPPACTAAPRRRSAVQPPPATFFGGTRDHRSFAQVIGKVDSHTPLNPIVIKANTKMVERLKHLVLIGEARSLDHIDNMPALMLLNEHTKYLGGLNIALGFDTPEEASTFLDDKRRWQDWFSWMIRAGTNSIQFQRLAWLNITGLPLHLWDESNFTLIAGRFG